MVFIYYLKTTFLMDNVSFEGHFIILYNIYLFIISHFTIYTLYMDYVNQTPKHIIYI